ncbi:MAG TPA: TIM-barrel domain-containing protein [Paludibacter sp.]|nr:TIM-barrel domain-containing protein [Paludibacter sp.]
MRKTVFLATFLFICALFSTKAQTDKTSLITNPSFEAGNLNGWTWTGTTGYAWLGPNTDGDATKNGSYICGIWNASIGDAECSQTLTVPNGYYKVTALATVSTNRSTNQRLFATAGGVTNSMLFGASSNTAYSAANLAILGANETYSFGGYTESSAENGPFKTLSVLSHVTDGNLTVGFRVNGKGSALGYDFSYSPKGDAGFFKFDNFTLTEVSAVATLDNITLSAGSLSSTFSSGTTTYAATLPVGTTTVTPTAVVSIAGETVSGNGAVDVSSGSGSSTITVTALDGTTTKTYTINYTVLTQSNDATLSALTTSAGTLSPVFNSPVTSYTVLLPMGTTSVTPTATKNDSKATVAGDTTVTVVNGKATSTIVVTAENGTTKTYTINYEIVYLTNPSFETGNLNGWTWTGTSGYAWLGPNTDGDATKNGSYICGIWNSPIGDAECSQTITGVPAGYYKVTALATVSANRTTNQRLFANSSSQLYGSSSNTNYSAANLDILTSLGETYSFGGYDESTAENGPFKRLSVVTHVTDGTLKVGFKVSGTGTSKGFVFTSTSSKNDEGFFKFDHFTVTEVSSVATLDNITLNEGTLNEAFSPNTTTYTATLPFGTKTVTPTIVLSADGQTVTGNGAVDVSGGSGVSTIVVKSIDEKATKTYTINYTVLTSSPYAISAFNTDSLGVNFTLAQGLMRVQVCNDKTIQVSYSLNSTLPQKDTIMVNKVWGKSDFAVVDGTDTVTINTQSLSVKVNKANSLVSYFDKSGNLVLSESQKTITPATVLTTSTNTCAATFNSPVTEGIYGLGQHQQRIMNYKGQTLSLDQQNGEIALPFLNSSLGYGLLWDNYSLTQFSGNVSSNTKYQFSSESGNMVNYYFMYGPELDSVIYQYRTATGKAPLFPKWAYGLFQSKDKYSTQAEILTLANKYRTANLPLDCIVQDWDYWTPDLWGSHTMDATKYPNPKAMVDSLHHMNLHTMISIWPVFHKNTANYQEYNAIGALYPSSGNHHFYDPHNDAAKKIYWNQVNSQLFGKYGWDAWWADNDEPQGWPDAFDRKNFMTAKGSGVTYYNTYPIQHTAAFFNGWIADKPDKRPFVLSRSAFPGQQRYATAVWSGDIASNWTKFQDQLSGGLNYSLSGMPYWTTDIGGYFYTDWSTAANNELMIRWFQYGAFCPIFRIHGQGEKALVSTSFTQATKDNLAATDKLRYRLMPYIYSNAWKVTNENYTIMRHLVMDYRTDANVKNIDNQFMFGPSMLINPVSSAGVTKRNVYLPAGNWYDFWTGKQYTGSQTINADAPISRIPVFVKAGAIIPMGPEITYATQAIDPTEIRIYQGANGSFTLYEDEGDTHNYEKGNYSVIPFTYNEATQELTIGTRTGSYNNMPANRNFNIVWVAENHGVGINAPVVCDTTVHYTGSSVVISRAVLGISNPIYNSINFKVYVNNSDKTANIAFTSADNGHAEISIADLTGKCLLKKDVEYKTGTNKYVVNMRKDGIGTGVFIVSLKTDDKLYTNKTIVK